MNIERSKTDLVDSLESQLASLEDLCGLYDQGRQHISKDIAVRIRVIFHQSNNSKSLINHLKIGHLPMTCTSFPYNPKSLSSHTGLIMIRFNQNFPEYLPVLNEASFMHKKVKQKNWWNSNKVIVNKNGLAFTRRKLILAVANTDGGAHVDSEFKEDYYGLSRLNSCGWIYFKDGVDYDLKSPVPASIRQIAHEVLETFKSVDIAEQSKVHTK